MTHVRANELAFPAPGALCGRDEEWKSLLGAYRRVVDNNVKTRSPTRSGGGAGGKRDFKSELVVVRGGTGAGKSFLVRKLKDCMLGRDSKKGFSSAGEAVPRGFFSQGDFDHSDGDECMGSGLPYSAITEAFNMLVDDLFREQPAEGEDINEAIEDNRMDMQKMIRKAVGSEGDIVASIVPSLRKAVDIGNDTGKKQRRSLLLSSDAATSLHFIFRSFVRAVCDCCAQTAGGGPLVLFLDNNESADEASFDLISSIATDPESRNLLLVLAMRDDQDSFKVLEDRLQAISEDGPGSNGAMPVTKIVIDDLDMETANNFISTVIRQRTEVTRPLAEVVHKRTRGNPFFMVQFLRRLKDSGLLEFSMTTFKWSWDVDRILRETVASDNVVINMDLVKNKIRELPDGFRFVLELASCLPSTVDSGILTKLALQFKKYKNEDRPFSLCNEDDITELLECVKTLDEDEIANALDLAVNEGIMEAVSSRRVGSSFKFTHPRIREATQGLIAERKARDEVHLRVGGVLRKMNESEDALVWMLFSSVDHLNMGFSKSIPWDEECRVELATLNLVAGEKAASISAFVPASEYLQVGVDLVSKKQCWADKNYVLCLQLHSELATCYYCCGKLDESKKSAKEVITNARVVEEKFRCYYTMIALLKAKGQLEDAVKYGTDLLSLVGEKFETKPSKIKLLTEQKKARKLISGYSDKELMSLPVCKDGCKAAAVKVLGILFGPMVHLGCHSAVDFLRLRSIRLTIKHGVCEASALAFAYYGSHLISSEVNLLEGYRFGKLALQLLKRLDAREVKARTILLAYFMIMHWKDPLQDTLDPLMNGYQVGMLNGDIEMAFTCAGVYQTHFYYCGMSLAAGEQDLRSFCQQMSEYKQTKELRTYVPLWQCMLNLMGRSANPTVMTGDAMDQEQFEKGKLGVVVMMSYRMQLAYYFGDLTLGETLVDKLRPHSESFAAPYFQVARRFFFSLILLGLAKRSKKQNPPKSVKKDIEWLKKRVNQGAINCLHKLLIVDAELSSFKGDPEKIQKGYDNAIVTARKSGFSQDEALANELAGAFFFARNDNFWATKYLTRAYQLYYEWGAMGKAKHLEEQYSTLISKEQRMAQGTNLKGRRRFSHRLSDSHQSVDSAISGVSSEGNVPTVIH